MYYSYSRYRLNSVNVKLLTLGTGSLPVKIAAFQKISDVASLWFCTGKDSEVVHPESYNETQKQRQAKRNTLQWHRLWCQPAVFLGFTIKPATKIRPGEDLREHSVCWWSYCLSSCETAADLYKERATSRCTCLQCKCYLPDGSSVVKEDVLAFSSVKV